MKRVLFITCMAFVVQQVESQTLYSNGATITLSNGSSTQVNGNAQIQSGSTITNDGTLTVTGNLVNNATMVAHNTGVLLFSGSTAQTLSGNSSFYAKDVAINNSAGITLNNTLRVDGAATFNNGVVAASDIINPIIFTSNASVSGTSNISHVNGYVVKEGTGSFTYPVGDGTSYQPIAVNSIANAGGIRVKYNGTDAGNHPFTGATPLLFYNTLEHWDVTPLSTATGQVTIYWDSYRNVGIGSTADLRVAHLSGTNWLNAGVSNVNGTTAAGNVTSDVISSWSSFTLGSMSVNSTLPLSWLSVSGNVNPNKQSVIDWRVSEYDVARYEIEKSDNGNNFVRVATIAGKGNGENNYSYSEPTTYQTITYYRIKQSDLDGTFSYSPIIKLTAQPVTEWVVYPIPFNGNFTVVSPSAQIARLISVDGKLIQNLQLRSGSNLVNTASLSKGIYILVAADGTTKRLIKQ